MQWYQERFVSHRDWILDHLELLDLSAQEAILVLVIDFNNEKRIPVTMESLAAKTKMKKEEVDEAVSLLCARKYLEIKVSRSGVVWSLDGLFEADTAKEAGLMDASLFDAFETEFGRTLNPREMEKISEWNRTIDKRLILYALRQASAYQQLSIAYVDKILSDWQKKGMTAEKMEWELSH